ncbi:MFS transporter [Intrasporangium sp.]|uniref:MFS transporter n=1 Tax=Intrasporangium sp. TaxID=1925024 RepID=UPI0032219A2A
MSAGTDPVPGSPGRSPGRFARGAGGAVALASLTVGGFAIGCTEFVAMGILPEVAAEFDPAGYARSHADAVAAMSVFVWGYALGVVLGAPVLGALSPRFRQGRFVAGSLLAMAVLTATMALMPSFGSVVVLRILAPLPHASYFGVAAIVAAGLLGSRHAARGVAVVLGGLTIANVVGAPVGTWLGQSLGWRVSYLSIAGVFAVAAVGSAWSLSGHGPDRAPRSPLHRALRPLVSRPLLGTITVYAFVNAGLFSVLTFAASIITTVAGLPVASVALVMAAMGIGMTVGNYAGGAIADRSWAAAAAFSALTAVLGFAALAGAVRWPVLVYPGFALIGATAGSVTPFVQVRLMRAVPSNPQLGSSMNSLCANAGSVIGGVVASAAIASTGAVLAAVWVGAALTGSGYLAATIWERGRATRGGSAAAR